MQGPIVDLVRLGMLVLFFWVQQRSRPQRYIRFWLAGWTAVFLNYIVWSVQVVGPRWGDLQSAVGFDFILLGVLIFLLSLLPAWQRPERMVQAGIAVGVVSVLILNVQEFVAVPKLVLVLMILLWQGDGAYIAGRLLRGKLVGTRRLIVAICVVYGMALVAYVVMTPAKNLDSWAVAEIVLCTAVLYWDQGQKRSLARWVGTVGFVVWAGFYFADIVLVNASLAQRLLNQFWSFPKYAVAATMILKIFEDAKEEQTRMAEKFRELYDDFRLIYDTHPHPMWICDEATGKFLTANAATLRVYGYTMLELKGMRLAELEAPRDAETEEVEVEVGLGVLADGKRVQHRHKDGRVVWVNAVERELMYLGREARFVISRDITEQMKQDRELTHRAYHDVLTGLPNRQLLADRLEQCLIASELEQRKSAILTIDIDHFKMINDTYGHLVGDECLKEVAERLKSKIRKADTISRTGGEEFVAIVSGLSHVLDAEKVAASLLRVFEAPMELAMGAIGVTVSIGVAVYPDDAKDAATLRRLSDEALYRAKRGGRNRAEYAHDVRARAGDLKTRVPARRSIEGRGV